MPLCAFQNDYLAKGVTPVVNIFIEHHLPHAPGDYVRVYLYGLMQPRRERLGVIPGRGGPIDSSPFFCTSRHG